MSDSTNDTTNNTDRMANGADRLAQQIQRTSSFLGKSTGNHGRSIEKAGRDIQDGLVAGSVVLLAGLAIGGLAKVLIGQDLSNLRKAQMIQSIIALREKYGPME